LDCPPEQDQDRQCENVHAYDPTILLQQVERERASQKWVRADVEANPPFFNITYAQSKLTSRCKFISEERRRDPRDLNCKRHRKWRCSVWVLNENKAADKDERVESTYYKRQKRVEVALAEGSEERLKCNDNASESSTNGQSDEGQSQPSSHGQPPTSCTRERLDYIKLPSQLLLHRHYTH
jgi:hypothetical protein